MSKAAFPFLSFVLPGTWVQVPLNDEVRVGRVVQLVEQHGAELEAVEGLRATLRELAASGGDQLYFQQDRTVPTVVLTAWPSEAAGSTEQLRAALPGGGTQAAQLPRTDGYVVLRHQHTGADVTYWIRHPGSGRVLALAVLFYGSPPPAAEPSFYDLLATTIGWDDDVAADA